MAREALLRRKDIAAAITASVISAIPVFLVASLAINLRRSIGLTTAQLGILISAYFLSAALGAIPASRFVEHFGSVLALRAGIFTLSLAMLFVAAVQSPAGLLIFMVATGIASSGLQVGTNQFLANRIPQGSQGFAFGAKQAAVPLAVVFGGASVPTVARLAGWRSTFIAFGILAAISGLLLYRLHSPDRPAEAHSRLAPLPFPNVLILSLLALGFALGVAASSALSAFAVSALVASGKSTTNAALITGFGGALAAASRVWVGIRADRGGRPRFGVVALMLSLGAVGYLGLAVAEMPGLARLLIPSLCVAFAAGWGWNGLFNFAIISRHVSHVARASGISAIGGRIGGVVGPAVFGFVAAKQSFAEAWVLAMCSALIGALVISIGGRLIDRPAP